MNGGGIYFRQPEDLTAEASEHHGGVYEQQQSQSTDDAPDPAKKKTRAGPSAEDLLQPPEQRGKTSGGRPYRGSRGNGHDGKPAPIDVLENGRDQLLQGTRQHRREKKEQLFPAQSCIRQDGNSQNDHRHDGQKKPERRRCRNGGDPAHIHVRGHRPNAFENAMQIYR